MEELVKYLAALVALQVRALMEKDDPQPVKPELLLAAAGFTAKEIAGLTGKTVPAVAKAITRARASRTGKRGSAA